MIGHCQSGSNADGSPNALQTFSRVGSQLTRSCSPIAKHLAKALGLVGPMCDSGLQVYGQVGVDCIIPAVT